MSRVCIVGHGPSLFTQERGEEIDGFDKVIRLKRCKETLEHPKIYGTQTYAVCGSWTIGALLKAVAAENYWVFLDSRHMDITKREIESARKWFNPDNLLVDRELCDHWNKKYRELRTPYNGPIPQMKLTRTSDPDYGHNHMSAGLHAVLYACEHLMPDELTLFGFDNVKNGDFTWSITRGPDWTQYPDHRWDIEKEMIGKIADYYHIKINFK